MLGHSLVIKPYGKEMKQLSIVLLFIFPLSLPANSKPFFPDELIGKWSPEIRNCEADFRWIDEGVSAVNNMVISKNQIVFWESKGTLISIQKSGKTYVINLEISGEGEAWKEQQSFTFSNDGNTLSRSVRGYEYSYHRCERK